MRYLSLVPAYGRDYSSAPAALADWNADKDFLVSDFSDPYDGKPVNRADAVLSGSYDAVKIRYSRLTKVAVLSLTPCDPGRPR